ncbi:MAG: hypothetical protein EAY81_12180 [Bacteroidetes bacterium]|nr:MAG: hypothetical protein EAY81_12180 [Bacteroidota bacterium]
MSLTSYPSNILMNDSLEIRFLDIQKSGYVFYFRLLLSGQTLDIFSKDKVVFYGEIVNSIKEYSYIKRGKHDLLKANQLYTEKLQIGTALSTKIAHHIIKSEQQSIPTDTLISSWTRWYLHCGSLVFEIKDEGKYVKQSFHCPWSQPDSVKFKSVILSNYDLLHQELKLDSVYEGFMSKLPKGKTYSKDGYRMAYIMTEKQRKAWEQDKPQRDYMKSVEDTISRYLKANLEKQKLNNISCFEVYHLTFNKDGKLCKLKVADYHRRKLFDDIGFYFEDKKAIRKCKKLIKRMFKEINLSSFKLRYKVVQTLRFERDGKVQLRGDTMY